MKRKLEAELISIAHRILKLKNKSELQQLQDETLKLYEKISVLRFVEENFSDVKPTIGYAQAEKEVEAAFEAQENVAEEPMAEPEIEETETAEAETSTIVEEAITVEDLGDIATDEKDNIALTEEPKEIVEAMVEEELKAVEEIPETETTELPAFDFEPSFEIAKETTSQHTTPKQITLEDFLTEGHIEPVFVRVEPEIITEKPVITEEVKEEQTEPEKEETTDPVMKPIRELPKEPKNLSLNDTLSKNISIGLNDRIGFEKHLFGGSSEDLNRVLSQLSTFSTYAEAEEFIEDMVKPDYNNWAGKEEFAARFMEIIENKFA
ncbi:hypothetical protein [Flavobacterium sp.]|uniref:hypothetical protein n=1 Tax=Flavobacterium sp. TaxID=239 RepID=UPI0026305939|nr:hypothetical protein [Flavobacterium sp.]MDD3005404.1 hypothetical protein [Flavobacterium sp.]